MASPDTLNIHRTVAEMRAAYADLLARKVNADPTLTDEDAGSHAVAEWAEYLEDVLLALLESGRLMYTGAGSPEGQVAAPPSSVYHNTSGGPSTSLYVKESGTGTSGWVAYGAGPSDVGEVADQVLVDIDFADLATQDFVSGGNGNYTIDGVQWAVANVAAADTFDLANGTGLRYNAAASSSVYHSGSRTAAYLRVPVATLIPTWDVMGTYVIEGYYPSLSLGVSNNRTVLGIDLDWSGTDRMLAGGRRNSSGTQQVYSTIDTASSILGNDAASNTVAVRFDAQGVASFGGTWASGWPRYTISGGQATAGNIVRTVMDDAAFIVIAFSPGEGSGGMTATLERLRIRRVRG